MINSDTTGFTTKLPAILPVKKTEHFNIYYYPESFAKKEIEHIAVQREKAYGDISTFLNAVTNTHIDLYLFDDAIVKETETGHTRKGAGWAFDNIMVEIYTESIKCHPYHELAHIIATDTLGYTISFLCEGLAVYLSCHFLNKDFGDEVNYNIHEKVARYHAENELFSLKELFSIQIGAIGSKNLVSYPQAGVIFEYLLNSYGKEKVFTLYKSLYSDFSNEGVAANIKEFERICGKPVEQINKEWLNTIV